MNTLGLNSLEKRSIMALASVYGVRMFGLFLILPVLVIYAEQLKGATPVLMGLALGVYGITQAVLQIPFGILSDKYGRKPLIFIGLGVFVTGSLIAAFSDTIYGVIVGRALQGAGAISSVVLALTSDLTRESQRTKAMAIIGMAIGMSFLLALLLAPLLEGYIGVKGLFILTALLAVLSMLIVWKTVPTPQQSHNLEVRAIPTQMLSLLKHPQLIRLDLGIFILHFVLTAMFVVVPVLLLEQAGLMSHDHWKVYVPALLGSIAFLVPMVILSGRKHLFRRIFLTAICVLFFAQCLFIWLPSSAIALWLCLLFFFCGFNLLEAMLPSLVSRVAPAATKGSAMGVYNTFQFAGVFLGGFSGGMLYGTYGEYSVFTVCGLLLMVWVGLVLSAPDTRFLDSMVVRLNGNDADNYSLLKAVQGIEDVVIIEDQATAYLKIDKERLDIKTLNSLIL